VASGSNTGAVGVCEERRPEMDNEVERWCHSGAPTVKRGGSDIKGADEVEWRTGAVLVRDIVRLKADG
jgi:hypothetical protein